MTVLLTAIEDWYCPNCAAADRTLGLPADSARFHICPGLHMLNAPLIRAGIPCKVTAEERQEHLGSAVQATGDDGVPYMAVRTTRSDGSDLVVNAELATGRLSDIIDAYGQTGFGS